MRITNKIMENNSLYNINNNKILQDKLSITRAETSIIDIFFILKSIYKMFIAFSQNITIMLHFSLIFKPVMMLSIKILYLAADAPI